MRINIALSLAIGVGGLILAGASLPVDTQITHRTQLGDRTQPYWLVPEQSKMLKVRGGLGIVRLFGALAGATGFGLAMHFAGEDEREQQKFWFRQSALDTVAQKTEQTFAEIDASTELNKKQMEAQAEVDLFSLRVQQNFRDAIGYIPQDYEQPALTHGKPGTLDEFTNPGDKVTESTSAAIEGGDGFKYLDQFLRETCLLWGNQGSGKSWTARLLAQRKKQVGYRLIILDPDSNRSEWLGAESYHLFEDIEKQIRWYITELKKRYRGFNESSVGEDEWRASLEPIAFVCDEITTYENFLDPVLLEEFFKLALTKSRKQEMPCTFIAHNNTQLAFGKKLTGLGNLIEKTLQLELVTTTDLKTLKPKSSGKGRFKGYESNQTIDVLLPKCDRKITDFRVDSTAPSAPSAPSAALDRTEIAQSPAPLLEKALSDSHQPHNPIPTGWKMADPNNMTALVRGVIVACIRTGWTQTRTIQEVFGITRSGSNSSYDLAREIFREISEFIGG